MTQHDRERTSLFLDNELTPEERAEFERDVEARPELKERLERWRDNDRRLRSALDLPLPAHVVARLGLARETVVDLAAHRAKVDRNGGKRVLWLGGGAIAASVAALLAFLPIPSSPENSDPLTTSTFQMAMQRLPSRQTIAVSAEASVRPELTFADSKGRFCREFTIQGSQPLIGIACRNGLHWKVEGTGPIEVTGDRAGEIRTAGGEDRSALNPIYERLQAGDPFDAAQESRLIGSGWHSPPNPSN
jgi:hypothetical protein